MPPMPWRSGPPCPTSRERLDDTLPVTTPWPAPCLVGSPPVSCQSQSPDGQRRPRGNGLVREPGLPSPRPASGCSGFTSFHHGFDRRPPKSLAATPWRGISPPRLAARPLLRRKVYPPDGVRSIPVRLGFVRRHETFLGRLRAATMRSLVRPRLRASGPGPSLKSVSGAASSPLPPGEVAAPQRVRAIAGWPVLASLGSRDGVDCDKPLRPPRRSRPKAARRSPSPAAEAATSPGGRGGNAAPATDFSNGRDAGCATARAGKRAHGTPVVRPSSGRDHFTADRGGEKAFC